MISGTVLSYWSPPPIWCTDGPEPAPTVHSYSSAVHHYGTCYNCTDKQNYPHHTLILPNNTALWYISKLYRTRLLHVHTHPLLHSSTPLRASPHHTPLLLGSAVLRYMLELYKTRLLHTQPLLLSSTPSYSTDSAERAPTNTIHRIIPSSQKYTTSVHNETVRLVQKHPPSYTHTPQLRPTTVHILTVQIEQNQHPTVHYYSSAVHH